MEKRRVLDADVGAHEVNHLVKEVGTVSVDGGGEMGKFVHEREERNNRSGQVHDTVLGVGCTSRAPESLRHDDPRRVNVRGMGDATDGLVEDFACQRSAWHLAFADVFACIDECLVDSAVVVRGGSRDDIGDEIASTQQTYLPISPRTPLVNERPDPPNDVPARCPAPKELEVVSTQVVPPAIEMP